MKTFFFGLLHFSVRILFVFDVVGFAAIDDWNGNFCEIWNCGWGTISSDSIHNLNCIISSHHFLNLWPKNWHQSSKELVISRKGVRFYPLPMAVYFIFWYTEINILIWAICIYILYNKLEPCCCFLSVLHETTMPTCLRIVIIQIYTPKPGESTHT